MGRLSSETLHFVSNLSFKIPYDQLKIVWNMERLQMSQKSIGKVEIGESGDAFSIRNTVNSVSMRSNLPHRLLRGFFLPLRIVTGRDNVSG
jgi:hypothetical protein